jgi:hypothetical protein
MKLHILGLAYPIMKGITPVVDNIIKQQLLHSKGEKNQFAYYLGMNNGAITITFGGVDMKYKLDMNEEFKWASISERNDRTITLIDIHKYTKNNLQQGINSENEMIGGNVWCVNGCNAIIDNETFCLEYCIQYLIPIKLLIYIYIFFFICVRS